MFHPYLENLYLYVEIHSFGQGKNLLGPHFSIILNQTNKQSQSCFTVLEDRQNEFIFHSKVS